jgi:hypothetical protein
MNLQSPCIRYPKSKKVGKSYKVCQEVFAPQAEDHLPRTKDATGVLMSQPRAVASLISTQSSFAAETSYHSGITDACITFVAASQHIQLALNARPSRQNS